MKKVTMARIQSKFALVRGGDVACVMLNHRERRQFNDGHGAKQEEENLGNVTQMLYQAFVGDDMTHFIDGHARE